MIFTPPTQHALRALIHLARHGADGPVHARVIAATEAIPSAFLAKILNRLRGRGFLRSVMGPGGGYLLARPSNEIRVHDIIEALDDSQHRRTSCLLGLSACSDDHACPLHDRWKSIRNDLSQWIGSLTLADIEQRFAPPTRPRPTHRGRRSTAARKRRRHAA